MASQYLQNDSPALKRKSARFRGVGRERPADIPGGGWRKSCAQRALWPLAAVVFYFAKKILDRCWAVLYALSVVVS